MRRPEGEANELGRALAALREARGLSRAAAAEAAGMSPETLGEYERGEHRPGPPALARLLAALGSSTAELAGLLRFAVEPASRVAWRTSALAGGGLSRALELLTESRLAERLSAPQAATTSPTAERRDADRAWEIVGALPTSDLRVLIEEVEALQGWAFCELLCHQCELFARADAVLAQELAELALTVAQGLAEPELRDRATAYALAFRGNAWRVAGDLPAAEADFSRAEELWPETVPGQPDVLDRTRLLDLRASLCRAERRLLEAQVLLERALAAGPRGAAGRARVLLKQAKTWEERGEPARAVAVLRQATPLLEAEPVPDLVFAHRFNLAETLLQLGRHAEAAPLLAEVRRRAREWNADLDQVRLLWLEGRIAARSGRRQEAIARFRQVRREFEVRQNPFDTALVTLELAILLLEAGRNGEVRRLAEEMVWIFSAEGVSREALAALQLFRDAARQEAASADLARRLLRDLEKAAGDRRKEPG